MGDHVHPLNVGADPAESVSPIPLDVATLTRGMVGGDESAYRAFYDAYFNRLSRYLLVVTGGDEDAAREALQATLVRVVRHVRVFPDEPSFWNWLAVLARSALGDQRKKRRRYFAFLDRFTEHTRVQSAIQADGQADAKLFAMLEHVVADLPSDERELVERKYIGRESVRDIAASLQTSEKAVESRLVRVRRKLKDALLTDLKNEQTD